MHCALHCSTAPQWQLIQDSQCSSPSSPPWPGCSLQGRKGGRGVGEGQEVCVKPPHNERLLVTGLASRTQHGNQPASGMPPALHPQLIAGVVPFTYTNTGRHSHSCPPASSAHAALSHAPPTPPPPTYAEARPMPKGHQPAWLGSLLGHEALRVEGGRVQLPRGLSPARVMLGKVGEGHLGGQGEGARGSTAAG
jgi:hypothetical protein